MAAMLKKALAITAGLAAAGLIFAGTIPRALARAEGLATSHVSQTFGAAPGDEPEHDPCAVSGFEQAASNNAISLEHMTWSPFGATEHGWAIYEAHVANDIGSDCAPDTAGFAAALARWQRSHALPADGDATVATLSLMKAAWQSSRPYVALRAAGICPDAPPEPSLARLSASEGYKGKQVMLRPEVAAAYRNMVEAARSEIPELNADREWLQIFSGYRSPAYDAGRCARDGNCGGAARAVCSVHRTGEAFDLDVGSAPGFAVDSSADANRLFQSHTTAYRWLVKNAGRFGFINYSFEPWHWEWRGPSNAPVEQASLVTGDGHQR
ncbi:MAG: D-alanyl-D-alanine carboxypeptidase [Caulobacteraceae bacterium]|nr:D-alanyl-D-alanine carboxypeptidase [Caulobacteraceae bacterium]